MPLCLRFKLYDENAAILLPALLGNYSSSASASALMLVISYGVVWYTK